MPPLFATQTPAGTAVARGRELPIDVLMGEDLQGRGIEFLDDRPRRFGCGVRPVEGDVDEPPIGRS